MLNDFITSIPDCSPRISGNQQSFLRSSQPFISEISKPLCYDSLDPTPSQSVLGKPTLALNCSPLAQPRLTQCAVCTYASVQRV